MSTGRALFTDAKVAGIQGDIVREDDELSRRVHFVEGAKGTEGFSGIVHKGLRFDQKNLFAFNDALAGESIALGFADRDVVAVG